MSTEQLSYKLLPVIFTGEMVCANQEGIKTRTSRLINCTNSYFDGTRLPAHLWKDHELDFTEAFVDNGPSIAGNPGPYLKQVYSKASDAHHRIYSIYNPDNYDVPLYLWVRERFFPFQKGSGLGAEYSYLYHADYGTHRLEATKFKWVANFYMPFDACRTLLRVTGFKIERIQDISVEDITAEGIDFGPTKRIAERITSSASPLRVFVQLWNKLHPGSWEQNDWVWVPLYELVDQDEFLELKALIHRDKSVSHENEK